ncbi:MAG: MFS transporter [Porphyromonadaceae bacterium]|nr:MFS transporter [Porphyromonadaceae bacterium]
MTQTFQTDKPKGSPIKWVPSVYFGMGLPFVTLSVVSVLMFKDLGISNEEITYWTSLLILPWSLKPIFSLVMELIGTKRQYIIITEMITALMFGLIAFALPLPSFFSIALALMAVMAVSGSTHDIAGDGIYMQELSERQQGEYVGWQGAFYNLAKILTNGFLVYLAGRLAQTMGQTKAWMVIMGISGAIMLLLAVYHLWVLPRETRKSQAKSFNDGMAELLEVVRSFFTKKYIWLYLAFIFLYRLAEGLAMKVAPLFLKDPIEQGGIGLSNEHYGVIYGTAGTIAFIVGSILSGYYISHFGLRRVLSSLVLIFNVPFGVFFLLALYQPSSLAWITTGIVFEYFSYGFGFVGVTLFMMQQIAPGKYQMAHYAFANSLMNLSVMVPGMISGKLSMLLGYQGFFIAVLIAAIPVILLSFFLPFAHNTDKSS